MDINNNQQINTFTGGMNTDTSDMFLKDDQYRYAENIRIVTEEDSNTGEVRLIEGTNVIKTIFPTNPKYRVGIKHIDSIRNYVIVIYVEGSYSYIVRYDVHDDGEWSSDHILYKSKENIIGAGVSTVLRYESDKLIHLYIANGVDPVMSLNIAGENPTTITLKKDLVGYASESLSQPTILISTTSGQLKPAKVLYTYRLYKLGGSATKIAPLSKVLSLYKTSDGEGYINTETTNKAVLITNIDSSTDSLDRLLIFRITYHTLGQLPTIDLIYDGKKIEQFLDTGYSNIDTLSVADLISNLNLIIKPKIIESKNDYLFYANVQYNLDDVDKKFKDLDTRSYSTGNYKYVDGDKTYINNDYPSIDTVIYHDQFDEDRVFSYNPEYWYKDKYAVDKIIGGTGPLIDWELVYSDDDSEVSLWPGEVYRYAIVFYDNDGNFSSPRWIADIMAPYMPGVDKVNKPCGVKFTIKQNDILDTYCSGYEIVRRERTVDDKITICEGVFGPALRLYRYEVDQYTPTGMLFPSGFFACADFKITNEDAEAVRDEDKRYAESDFKKMMFASPEYVYQPDDTEDLLKRIKNNIMMCPYLQYAITTKTHKWERTDDPTTVEVEESFTKTFIFPDALEEDNGDTLHCHSMLFETIQSTFYYGGKNSWDADYRYVLDEDRIDGATHCINETGAGEIFFNHMLSQSKPKNINDSGDSDVENISFIPESPQYNKFGAGDKVRILDDVIGIGADLFINWSAPLATIDGLPTLGNVYKETHDTAEGITYLYPIGSVGRCIILDLHYEFQMRGQFDIFTANIRNKSAKPYGGYNDVSLLTSTYLSFGDYVKYNKEQSTIDVFDGDCYITTFRYNASHDWYDGTFILGPRMATVYEFPIHTSLDLNALSGVFAWKNKRDYSKYYHQQDDVCSFLGYTQNKPAYSYNTAYSATPNAVTSNAVEYTEISTNNFDVRIHYSLPKTNNENIDSWLITKSADFLDVDSRFGSITQLKLFKDRLVFWQEHATGLLSVNERVVLNNVSDTNIILGTGGILDRYDYITTTFGMKGRQYTNAQSDNILYWWDELRKEILAYSGGTEVMPLTVTKNVTNYINKHSVTENPHLVYDYNYNELIANVVNDESLVYNERIGLFSSIYKINPVYSTFVNGKVYITDNKSNNASFIYKMDESEDGEQSLGFDKNVLLPRIDYVVNKEPTYNKTFDIATFGGRFYGGDDMTSINMKFKTPLKQEGKVVNGNGITNREYDYRVAVPRNNDSEYGDRLRGKTMQCEFSSTSNSLDFSLQYITTKFRMSWS